MKRGYKWRGDGIHQRKATPTAQIAALGGFFTQRSHLARGFSFLDFDSLCRTD